MAPAGRIASESPVTRVKGTMAGGTVAPVIEYPASRWGMNSEAPPYNSWVAEWDNNLPTDLQGTGYIRMKWTAVDPAVTSVDFMMEAMNWLGPESGWFVTVTGGPWAVGDVVESPPFTVDLDGNDSSEIVIAWTYQSWYPEGMAYAPGFAAEDVVLVMTEQTVPTP